MNDTPDSRERRFLPTIDTELRFESAELGRLHDHWLRIRGERKMPRREDLDPLDIPDLLPYVALIDVECAPRRFRWRLIGTHITRAMGRDRTGNYFDEAYSGKVLDDLMAVYERVVQSRTPIRHFGRPTFADKAYSNYESTHLPFSESDESVDIILVGLVFLEP